MVSRTLSIRICSLLCLLIFMAAAGTGFAAGLKIGDEKTYLKLALLLQGWAAFSDQEAPDGVSLDTDLYLRRLRLLFIGQLHEKVNFFVETDNPNFGKQGDFSPHTFIQDAWLEYDLYPALQIDVGMLLVPFSHQGMQGAVSLHTIDYHSSLIRYPKGSNLVWRDFGVMLRGMVIDEVIEYRLALLNGVHGGPPDDERNPRDWPRLTARLTWNLFDAEGGPGVGGFFYDGVYLEKNDGGVFSSKKVLSFGISLDWQKDLNVKPSISTVAPLQREDYFALALDMFFDLPLSREGRFAISGQLDFFYYDYGKADTLYHNGNDARYGMNFTGNGLLAEVGLRYDAYEVLFCVDWFEATVAGGGQGDLLAFYGGINWWLMAHANSIKFQIGSNNINNEGWSLFGQIQVQLLF